MSDQENLSSVGRSILKDIVTVRDLLDYRACLEKKDKSPLAPETIRDIKDPGKGWLFVIGELADRFNASPADAIAAAKLFGFALDPADPRIRISQFAAVLNDLGSAGDLKTALARLDSPAAKAISKQGRALLRQILYIRDFLDYFRFLVAGDKRKGLPSPLSTQLLDGFHDPKKGGAKTYWKLVKQFNADPADVKLAVNIFGLKAAPGAPLKPRDLASGEGAFRIMEHSAALKQNLCKIDKAECPEVPSAPAEPKPAETSARNKDLLDQVRVQLFIGNLPAAVKTWKKIAPTGLSAIDAQTVKDFESGLIWLSRAAEEVKKGNKAAAGSDYMAAKLMLPAEAGGLIDKKLAALGQLGAPAAAAPARPTLKRLPEDKPEEVAKDLQNELKAEFARKREDPQVKNFGASKIRIKIAATPDPDLATVHFRAKIIVESYESDILKVITPCTILYSLPPGYTMAKLDTFLSRVQQQADTNTFTITKENSAD
jgi:hypothetical protein